MLLSVEKELRGAARVAEPPCSSRGRERAAARKHADLRLNRLLLIVRPLTKSCFPDVAGPRMEELSQPMIVNGFAARLAFARSGRFWIAIAFVAAVVVVRVSGLCEFLSLAALSSDRRALGT